MVPRVRKIDFKMSVQAQPIHASLFIRSTGGVNLEGMARSRVGKSTPITCVCACITHVIESNTGLSRSLDCVALMEATERCY